MSILDRAALQDSPLADLHAIASALSIDGYRRLRRPLLIDAILARGDLRDYRLAHAARAEFCRRLGKKAEARAAYEQYLALQPKGKHAADLRAILGSL